MIPLCSVPPPHTHTTHTHHPPALAPASIWLQDFQGDQLPPQLQRLVARVREVTGIKGPLRDVTINYRHSTFLRLVSECSEEVKGVSEH
jgi:hypothetical protein